MGFPGRRGELNLINGKPRLDAFTSVVVCRSGPENTVVGHQKARLGEGI